MNTIELTKEEENFLSAFAENEPVIDFLLEKVMNYVKNQMIDEKITVPEARGARLCLTKLAKTLKSYK